MKKLFLVIKKKYFEEILAGTKTEEYREVKPYWTAKLEGRQYDVVEFQAGYRADSPKFTIEFKGCEVRTMRHEFFGDRAVDVYAIKLGKILQLNAAK
jgi:hypothetical protein